jgi:hypothetical protein
MRAELLPPNVSMRSLILRGALISAVLTFAVTGAFRTALLIVDQQATFNGTIICVAGGNNTSTGGIAECLNQLGGNPGKVELSGGTFNVSASIHLASDKQVVVGAGKGATTIVFAPSSPIPLFVMSHGALESVENELGGFEVISSVPVGDAIQLVDTSEPYVHDVNIQTWNGTGIHLEGRELGNLDRLQINANNPIVIDANPNSTIELDAFDLQSVNLTVLASGGPGLGTGNAITITGITPTTVIQHQSWNRIDIEGGLNGVDLEDANASGFAFIGWDLRNMHWEQQQGPVGAGYMLKFNRAVGFMNDVTLTNILAGGGGGAPNNGFFFRNTLAMTATTLGFDGTASMVALDVDASNVNFTLVNPFFQTGSTVTNNSSQNSIDVGGTPNALALHGNQIHNVAAPTAGTDAANQSYVLAQATAAVNAAVSGTAGSIPLFTGAHTIGNSNEVDNGSFFGAGPNFFVALTGANAGGITQIGPAASLLEGSLNVEGNVLLNTNTGGVVQSYGELEVISGVIAQWFVNPTTGHMGFGGPTMTNTNLSSCGGSPNVKGSSTDMAGGAAPGAGATACTVTYVNNYGTTGNCVLTGTAGFVGLTSESAAGFTAVLSVPGDSFTWVCPDLGGGS